MLLFALCGLKIEAKSCQLFSYNASSLAKKDKQTLGERNSSPTSQGQRQASCHCVFCWFKDNPFHPPAAGVHYMYIVSVFNLLKMKRSYIEIKKHKGYLNEHISVIIISNKLRTERTIVIYGSGDWRATAYIHGKCFCGRDRLLT